MSTTLLPVSGTDDLLRNNEKYAATFADGGHPAPPVTKVAIVTCMDARLDPARARARTR